MNFHRTKCLKLHNFSFSVRVRILKFDFRRFEPYNQANSQFELIKAMQKRKKEITSLNWNQLGSHRYTSPILLKLINENQQKSKKKIRFINCNYISLIIKYYCYLSLSDFVHYLYCFVAKSMLIQFVNKYILCNKVTPPLFFLFGSILHLLRDKPF